MNDNAAFDTIAAAYDQEFTHSATGQLQRKRVYHYLQQFLQSCAYQHVVEINCGTGEDALWLVKHGKHVLATDISAQMVAKVTQKRAQLPPAQQDLLNVKRCSATQLEAIAAHAEKFDLLLSNFGGLNCLSPTELAQFLIDAEKLLRPGGCMALVIMGRFCWWESGYYLAKAKFKTAFRRLAKASVSAQLDENTSVDTWYYSPRWVAKHAPTFKRIGLHPIGFWLPPSYLDPFFKRHPSSLKKLYWLEKKISSLSSLVYGADHYLLLLQRN